MQGSKSGGESMACRRRRSDPRCCRQYAFLHLPMVFLLPSRVVFLICVGDFIFLPVKAFLLSVLIVCVAELWEELQARPGICRNNLSKRCPAYPGCRQGLLRRFTGITDCCAPRSLPSCSLRFCLACGPSSASGGFSLLDGSTGRS